MSVGAELADARRRLGLSVDDISARTKIKVERLTAIEEMDAAQLPTLVYLKGFVRAYAAQVELDPDEVTQRYLAELDVVSPSYAQAATPSTPAAPDDESTRTLAVDSSANRIASEPEFDPDDIRRPEMTSNVEPVIEPDRLHHAGPHPADARFFREYVAPIDEREFAFARSSPRRRSRANYAAAFLVLLVAVVAGWWLGANFDSLSERLARRSADAPAATAASADVRDGRDAVRREQPGGNREATDARRVPADAGSEPRAARDDASTAVRRPVETPAERAANVDRAASDAVVDSVPREISAAPTVQSRAPESRVGESRDRDADLPPATPSRGARGADAASPEKSAAARAEASAAPDTRAAAREEPTAVPTERDGARRNVSGRWALTNRVESSSLATFQGLNVGFHLQLRQEGNRVTGTGQKWMENGKPLPSSARTPISVEGSLNGDTLELTFTERGTRRTSAGKFVLNVAPDGTMQGTFVSDAANSQGTSLARRREPPRP